MDISKIIVMLIQPDNYSFSERVEAAGWLDSNFAGSIDNKEYYAKLCEDYMKDCLGDKDVQKHWKQIKSNNNLYAKLIRES